MFRVLYPPTHRSTAVGWVKSIAAISALATTMLGTMWFLSQPEYFYLVCWVVGLALVLSAGSYARIPVPKTNEFADSSALPPHRAFVAGLRLFLSDRRFVLYQIGFWFAGFANHMSHAYVAESLKEDVGASDASIFWIVAVLPALLMASSAPVWGRLLDRINPMVGRALFNGFQCVAYGLHFYGGISQQVWPFLVGSMIHAIGNGGGTVNWLTGSMYFASQENVSLYNSIHVGLTGVRGLLAPVIGVWIYGANLNFGTLQIPGLNMGPTLFVLSAILSLVGVFFMLWMSRWDSGRTAAANVAVQHESAGTASAI